MKLRYSPASPYARKVVLVAIEGGLDAAVERVNTSVSPVAENPDMTKENPLGKVPALILADGSALYDSRVICEYLDSLNTGAKFFPAAGPARWTALRLQALGDGILDAALLARYETAMRPAELMWPSWRDGQLRKVHAGIAAAEAELASFSGAMTIGTFAIASALGYIDFRFAGEPWRTRHPKLAAWFDEFSKRPSMQATKPG